MRILIFEYITGGGLIGEELPSSLAKEGDLMLQALLQDLADLPEVELLVCRDWRMPLPQCSGNFRMVKISENCNRSDWFDILLHDCDAVWPIAPETGGILQNYCSRIEAAGKLLLSSPAAAVALCGDKLLTHDRLIRGAIPCVPTIALPDTLPVADRRWVVKSKDGAGCSDTYIIAGEQNFRYLVSTLSNPDNFVLQPLLAGQPASLSCLFKHGTAALLSYNEQLIAMKGGTFELQGCIVNAPCAAWEQYAHFAESVAQAFPDLWGYAGVDILVTDGGPLVVEINPRLTTSYAGLRHALALNTARHVLDLLHADVPQTMPGGQPVTVNIIREI